MAGRASLVRAEPGFTLPFFERLAPPPPPAPRRRRGSRPSRSRATSSSTSPAAAAGSPAPRSTASAGSTSLESSPLTRLLAELVLRPPDLRHLDAAFQAMGASPRGQTSLKIAVGELFATRCATCGRALVADEFIWPGQDQPDHGASAEAAARADAADAVDAESDHPRRRSDDHDDAGRPSRSPPARSTAARSAAASAAASSAPPSSTRPTSIAPGRSRTTTPRPAPGSATASRSSRAATGSSTGCSTSTRRASSSGSRRSSTGSKATCARRPSRPPSGSSFLHALLPASRLNGYPGSHRRRSASRPATSAPPAPGPWRERNPWLAFEDGIRTVRGFIQRLESGPGGAVQARLGNDLQALDEGAATAVVGIAGPSTTRAIGAEAAPGAAGTALRRPAAAAPADPPRPRPAAGPPEPGAPVDDLLGDGLDARLARRRSALPLAALSGPAIRAPWGWQAAALARSLASVEPSIARDGRVVFLVDGGPEALVAAALGGVEAGFRLLSARLGDGDDEAIGSVELLPPGAVPPPSPRTRANVALDPSPAAPATRRSCPAPASSRARADRPPAVLGGGRRADGRRRRRRVA